jgi:hypothetical protein
MREAILKKFEIGITSETIEELECAIKVAKIDAKRVDPQKLFAGILCISSKYARKIYDEIGRLGLPRDEIEGTGVDPGTGHIIWATAVITTAWTSWLFEDKGKHRISEEVAKKYKDIVTDSITKAISIGQSYVGKERKPLGC